MPLPRPRKTEEKEEFVSRCIATMTREESDEFPDRKQRAAICYSQWNRDAEKNGKQPDTGPKKKKSDTAKK